MPMAILGGHQIGDHTNHTHALKQGQDAGAVPCRPDGVRYEPGQNRGRHADLHVRLRAGDRRFRICPVQAGVPGADRTGAGKRRHRLSGTAVL